ncbi:MAG TPA: sterol desaturase family protein [Leptospiraceae bacterium]|nr:sterol desaturase family protein [Leptospiraceae bacterium]HMW06919.1 sterol desaturase family protein [Leptospiraceae bacterium]HMX32281.1 sterol desaturase family protein [Leptospiraceae bacterium]HMY33449.1 sterol desaturase family protein [Leptospiraceae bacterium]HMZ65483.1 sterol desaturase family protein [Leptospiraceae bacterium]
METFLDYFFYWLTGVSISLVLYFGLGSIAFLLFWKWKISKKRIQEKEKADKAQFKTEIIHSIYSLFLFAIIDMVAYFLQKQGYTQIYEDISTYGWGYFFLSILFMLILHDAYFYWAHRFMHLKPIYKYIHKVHHESVDTTPYTAFSFHPLEAIVEYGIIPIFIFSFPTHFYSLLIFQILMTGFNVIGHMGYEIYPKNWLQIPILNWKTTSVHHNLHHSKFNGNYGLYFTWWDKWMNTEFPNYESELIRVNQKDNLVTNLIEGKV